MPGTWGFKGFQELALEFPAGSEVEVSPPGRARMRYDESINELQVSLNGGAYLAFGNPSDVDIDDNDANAFLVHEGANDYIHVSTVNGSESVTLGNATTNPALVYTGKSHTINLLDNAATALRALEGANIYLSIGTTNGLEGVGIGNSLSQVSVTVKDNNANAMTVAEAANTYFKIATTDGSESVTIGNTLSSMVLAVKDNAASVFTVNEGANRYIAITTTDGSELIAIGNALASLAIAVKDNNATALTISEAANVYMTVDTTNGAEAVTIGAAPAGCDIILGNATSNFSIFGGAGSGQVTMGSNITNNVTAGGVDGTIANYTDLTIYANDAAAIRNDIYQLSRMLKIIWDRMRVWGFGT